MRVRRVEAGVEACDYADAFALELDQPDEHTAQEWARTALEGAPAALRAVVRFALVRVLRLRLQDGGVFGWRIVSSTPEELRLQADGPVLRAALLARRDSPWSAVVTTWLVYERPVARWLWVVVGPVHRAVVPYLLRRAARSFGVR